MVTVTTTDATQKTLDEHFPNSITIKELFDKIGVELESAGTSKDKVRFAKATCRDDSIEEIAEELRDRGYLSAFRMEALAGFPVFGKTSVGAWYHHIPDEGYGVIIMAPHIGIDSDGNLGYLDRHGQSHVGKSCGAQHAIVAAFQEGNVGPYEDDRELSDVASHVKQHKDEIVGSEQPLLTLTNILYERGLNMLSQYIKMVQTAETHKFPIYVFAGVNVDTKSDDQNRFHLRHVRLFQDGNVTEKFDYKT